jgi:3-hydroxy-9,10-secoandrosta-1,3,5(10)-triene-9,17-dione monooxygenase
MDHEALVESAEKLLPELGERTAETEVLRQLPKATVRSMLDAGLTRALQPTRFGGSGLGASTHIALTSTLAHGCVSTGWCEFVWAAHNKLLTMYPDAAQEAVWGDDPESMISASLGPVGRAEPVDGGMRVSGRWTFASGCDHAEWLFLGAVAASADPPLPYLVLVPKSEIEVVDTWHVMGLRGTGSKDIVAEEVFVPTARFLPWGDVVGKLMGLAVTVIAGPVLGGAEAAVARFQERLADRVLASNLEKQSKMGVARMRLAESAVEVDAARLLLERNAREIDEWSAAGMPDNPPNARWVRDTGYCAELSTRATQRVFEASGGGALQESEPIQRIWRDVNAGHAHAFLGWDQAAETWATAALAGTGD